MTRYILPQGGDSTVIYDTAGFEALTADELRAVIAGWEDVIVARAPGGAWELFIDELEEIPPEVTDVEAWAAEHRETPLGVIEQILEDDIKAREAYDQAESR